jgi:inosine/xanthosine triphosphatase
MLIDAPASTVAFERLFGASAFVLLTQLPAFVVGLASLGKAQLNLSKAALEVEAQRDERVAPLLDLGGQPNELTMVKKEATVSVGIDVVDGAFFIRGNVNTLENCFFVVNGGVSFLERALPVAETLHLRSHKDEAGFHGLFDDVLVPRLAIGRCHLVCHAARLASRRLLRNLDKANRMVLMKVHVGTGNPIKVKAVRTAFETVFSGKLLEVTAVPVEPGVPSQPFGEAVIRGATRRAKRSLGEADYGVGIEAGLVQSPGCDHPLNVQFCAIVDRFGRMTVGHGPGFELPNAVVEKLRAGSTLSDEVSRAAGIPEIKEAIGAIGVLSGGRIDRLAITCEAVLMALVPRIDNRVADMDHLSMESRREEE